MRTTIYFLSDPRDRRIRYVGKTVNMRVRFQNHLADASKGKRRMPVCLWIRELLKAGAEPVLTVIEECDGDGAAEEQHHILLGRRDGLSLLNLTDGGEGCIGYRHDAESRAKMSAARKGVPKSAEFRAMVSRTQTGRKQSPETIAKRVPKLRGRKLSPAQIENLRRIHTGKKLTPEHRAKIGAAGAGRVVSAKTRAKISAALSGRVFSAETRAKISASKRKGKGAQLLLF